jgi:Ca2+-binding EF-hand superfamily protein
MAGISDEIKGEIDEVFNLFDSDSSGKIDVNELESALFTITGERLPRDEVVALIKRYDEKADGELSKEEFTTMVMERLKGRTFQEETARAFKLLEDPNAAGAITKDSLRRAAAECGERLTEDDINEMFDTLVTGNPSPVVDFATFCSIQFAASSSDSK